MSKEANYERYLRAMHGVQSGVAYEMTKDTKPTDPKHLRVGINAAMIEHGALVKVLFDKGVLTEDEYYAALADGAEEELRRYEERAPGVRFR